MKIIAEFNSTNEVLDFINIFGAKVASQITIDGAKVCSNIKEKVNGPVNDEVKVTKETTKAEEEIGQANDVSKVKETEGIKITKEQVREVFSKLIKAGKQKEAKELTTKYGASKVGEVKEEDYAAILKDAEELL